MRRYFLLYIITLTIPLLLGAAAWQATRYSELVRELDRLETTQQEWIESNKRLIAGISVLSSAERIEQIATGSLKLVKKQPEDVLQIRIENRRGRTNG
jgi:cell division protein FtsL